MAMSLTCPTCRNRVEHWIAGSDLSCPNCGRCFQTNGDEGYQPPPVAKAGEPVRPAPSVALDILDDLEGLGCRMIAGIGHFMTEELPHWVGRQIVDLTRITIKLTRVL